MSHTQCHTHTQLHTRIHARTLALATFVQCTRKDKRHSGPHMTAVLSSLQMTPNQDIVSPQGGVDRSHGSTRVQWGPFIPLYTSINAAR